MKEPSRRTFLKLVVWAAGSGAITTIIDRLVKTLVRKKYPEGIDLQKELIIRDLRTFSTIVNEGAISQKIMEGSQEYPQNIVIPKTGEITMEQIPWDFLVRVINFASQTNRITCGLVKNSEFYAKKTDLMTSFSAEHQILVLNRSEDCFFCNERNFPADENSYLSIINLQNSIHKGYYRRGKYDSLGLSFSQYYSYALAIIKGMGLEIQDCNNGFNSVNLAENMAAAWVSESPREWQHQPSPEYFCPEVWNVFHGQNPDLR